MKNVSLRQLRIFATVGKHLSFSRAAEELALTAPAVSMQIKDLEEQVGMLLFDTDRKFNRMRPSMARVLGLETRSAKEG